MFQEYQTSVLSLWTLYCLSMLGIEGCLPTCVRAYTNQQHFSCNMFSSQSVNIQKCCKFFLDFHIFINIAEAKRKNLVITSSYFFCRNTMEGKPFLSFTISLRIIFLPIISIISFWLAGLKFVLSWGASKCYFNSGQQFCSSFR